MSESVLQAKLLLEAPKRIPHLRLFRRNVVVARMENRTVRAGIKGQCDLYGYFRGSIAVEVELKAAGKSSSPEQRAWAEWCKEWRVIHAVLRAQKGESDEQTIDRWCAELAELYERYARGS